MDALEQNAVVPKEEQLPSVVSRDLAINQDAEEDYEFVRKVLQETLGKSSDAVDRMMELAQEAEHPRAFEVLANMLKTTTDIAQQLIELQKKRHELDEMNNPGKEKQSKTGSGNTTNNTVFVGSTAELQKFLKKQNKEKMAVDIECE